MTEPGEILAAAKRRLVELALAGEEEGAEGTSLALLLAPRSVPGLEQRRADKARLTELFYRRLQVRLQGPVVLSDAAAEELVWAVARQARYRTSSEGVGRARLFVLRNCSPRRVWDGSWNGGAFGEWQAVEG